jgi:transcriptional regulator with XRE-family HTH domain
MDANQFTGGFGAKLRQLRTEHELTLKELAARLGLQAHGYLSEIESGKKSPTTDLVLGVARLFRVSTDVLLKDEFVLYQPGLPSGSQRQTLPFVNRPPTARELERLRLILSTFQDGTGMLLDSRRPGQSLPGWRDFERATALAFGGVAQESKAIFDVLLYDGLESPTSFGFSCKMRGELQRIDRDGRVTIELSNSARKFWGRLNQVQIDPTNYRNYPQDVGRILLDEVQQWHSQTQDTSNTRVDLAHSYYLALSWSRKGDYQLHQFKLALPGAETLQWSCPMSKATPPRQSQRIIGEDTNGILYEWHGESGGQLKYYPSASDAIWHSEVFQLERLPPIEHGLMTKVATYFPDQWRWANEPES